MWYNTKGCQMVAPALGTKRGEESPNIRPAYTAN